MKRTITAAALAAAAITGIGMVGPAEAQVPARSQTAQTTCGTCVAPITCTVEDQCVLDFVGNNGAGYWRAR